MVNKKFIEWNERMFKKYNNVRLYDHPNPLIRYTENKRVRMLAEGVSGSDRVLDVGCGEGYVLARIRSKEIVGLDISETALERISGSRARLVRADAARMPFTDSYFDGAICSETLEHVPEPGKIVKEISRVVRPGGIVLLSVPNEPLINLVKDIIWNLGLFGIVFPNVPRRQNDEWHLHSFDLKKLREVCKGLLEIKKISAVPFFFFPIRYVATCLVPKKRPERAGTLFSRKLKVLDKYLDDLVNL
jgi:ubiquinone/menaquinone biosynthesis C-methylase UbiE